MVRTARPEIATSASVKRSRQHDLKCRLKSRYFNHSSQGNSTNYDIILGPRDKAAPTTSQQIGQFPPNRMKYRHCRPFVFFFLPHSQESCLCSQPICRGKVRQTGRIFPEHRPAERIRSFLDPEGNRGHSPSRLTYVHFGSNVLLGLLCVPLNVGLTVVSVVCWIRSCSGGYFMPQHRLVFSCFGFFWWLGLCDAAIIVFTWIGVPARAK